MLDQTVFFSNYSTKYGQRRRLLTQQRFRWGSRSLGQGPDASLAWLCSRVPGRRREKKKKKGPREFDWTKATFGHYAWARADAYLGRCEFLLLAVLWLTTEWLQDFGP